ncbi:MAG TPA: hypothetical protein PK562_04790, partial [Candidatus Omnitrophota bacterium]|nr:hypothetical protein [Candidatus Omnitrophota bacterium]
MTSLRRQKNRNRFFGGRRAERGSPRSIAADLAGLISSLDVPSILGAERPGEHPFVIRLVQGIICDAVEKNASDIHIEPQEKSL